MSRHPFYPRKSPGLERLLPDRRTVSIDFCEEQVAEFVGNILGRISSQGGLIALIDRRDLHRRWVADILKG